MVDLIGKVGEDPGASWIDSVGNFWTKDHTLIRKPFISQGVSMNPTFFDPTLEWDSLPANSFMNLGFHDCDCNITSNINELNNNLEIYPNPTNGKKQVYISNDYVIKELLVIDQLGKVISIQKADNTRTSIDISKYSSGLYFISIIDKYGIKTRPIILKNE